ncbi:hypothetical protein ACHMW6_32220 [Pseudoduganella sp. UC29_106]|uniref:hypothetical protein n=1 Tax=Pseudoduganella sp. UC29_106 TaxID=3374553 RepID=UPI003756D08A
MRGDGLLLLHLDRAGYPWRYADADIGSVVYIDLAPHCACPRPAGPARRADRAGCGWGAPATLM